jgi:hypothetical protein
VKQWKAALLALVGTLPVLAWAHGGEDHGAEKPAPSAVANGPAVGAMGETFEVLLKAAESEPNEATELRVFVSDARTNAPLAGAEVELSFLGASEVKQAAAATGSAGIYTATATFPSEGAWEALATVRRGSATEVLSLGPWKVEEAHAHAEEASPAGAGAKAPLLALLVLGVAGAALWAARRTLRARRRHQEVPHAR